MPLHVISPAGTETMNNKLSVGCETLNDLCRFKIIAHDKRSIRSVNSSIMIYVLTGCKAAY